MAYWARVHYQFHPGPAHQRRPFGLFLVEFHHGGHPIGLSMGNAM